LKREQGKEGSKSKCCGTLTELVADLEAGLLGPGVEGLASGVGDGPAIVAADLVLRRAGGRDEEAEAAAGEPQTAQPRRRHG
jgi:hypothetical protein